MGWTSTNDHYNGFYIGEFQESINNPSSITSKYRRKRRALLDKLDTLQPKVALGLIESEFIEYDDILKAEYVDIHEKLNQNTLFDDFHESYNIPKSEGLLIASYLLFLAQIYKEKEIIFNIIKDNTELNKSPSESPIGDSEKPSKSQNLLGRKYKTNIFKTPTKNLLTLEEIGVLFVILQKNGFTNEMSNLSYGDIGHLLTGGSAEKIRKAMTYDQYDKLTTTYRNQPSTHHLDKIKIFLKELIKCVDELKSKRD
jgi:hypothetical protein